MTSSEHAAQVGEAIYEQQLKPLLELSHRAQVVTIHHPSQDHSLGHSILEAADRLRQKYPNAARGEVYARGAGERAVIRSRPSRIIRMKE